MHRLLLLLWIVCLLPMVSCVPATSHPGWTVADLRLLDPLDATPTPSTDILAVYIRTVGSDLEIRVDLLDLPLTPDYHLQIVLDLLPGTNSRDLTIDLPASGHPTVIPANPNLIPRLIRDPWMDTITVRINRLFIPQPFTLHVAAFKPGLTDPVDVTAQVLSDGLPPTQRAPLALVFWDVLPAATPAQALRRWDGAHTGPNGGRHGLKYLLDNASQAGAPLALLDLKTPASLAALDYLGFTPQIQKMADRGLLILPDVAYGEPAKVSLEFSRRASIAFGLPTSQFAFNPAGNLLPDYLVQFLPLDTLSHLAFSGRSRLIPLPNADAIQATPDGPSLDLRRNLVTAAFSADQSDLVVVGGDLPHSTWGNEDMASSTFAWIAAHPWIHPLSADDLLTFPTGKTDLDLPELNSVASPVLSALPTAPNNPITDAAWQAYFMLTTPTTDEKLLLLRSNYLNQVGELLAAAEWAERPAIQSNCDRDLNNDDQPECILANQDLFSILDPLGARLTYLFSLDETGPHQLIGPSSQVTVGLSDPSEWHPELGLAADPSVIPGAFSDEPNPWMLYSKEVSPEGIIFTSPDGRDVKSYRISERGIDITYQVSGTVSTRIPLVVDPQAFILGPTTYLSAPGSNEWSWGLVGEIQVEVITDATLSGLSFTDSLPFMSQSEDPNRAYPGGHYLPFPLSVITIQGAQNFRIQISIK